MMQVCAACSARYVCAPVATLIVDTGLRLLLIREVYELAANIVAESVETSGDMQYRF